MALKISTDGFLKIERSSSGIFTIKNISSILKTDSDYIKFIDMGPFILVVDAGPDRPMNSVGSLYFRFSIFGNLLVLTGNELDSKSPIVTENNSKWASQELESGMIQNIKEVLLTYKAVMTSDDSQQSSLPQNVVPAQENKTNKTGKTVYHFDPDGNGKISENEEKFTGDFYQRAFEVIEKASGVDISSLTLYEDYDVIIKFTPGKVKKTIDDMINYFTSTEEYEKCAVLQKTSEHIKDITNTNNAIQE